MLTKDRDKLFKKVEQVAADKKKIFQQGATQKSPELRKALAMQFELKTQEQLMTARELNLRSKELLTVSRLRMVRENNERGRAMGRLNLTDKDVAKIAGFIEDDKIKLEAVMAFDANASPIDTALVKAVAEATKRRYPDAIIRAGRVKVL